MAGRQAVSPAWARRASFLEKKDTWQAGGEKGEEGDVDGKQSDSFWVNGGGMHPGLEGR